MQIHSLLIYTMLIIFFVPNFTLAAANSEFITIIKNLGKKPGYETDIKAQSMDFYKLDKNRTQAIYLLVKELKPVKGEYIDINKSYNTESLHVVWCLRALRFLSGCVFFTEKEGNDRFNEKDQTRIILLMEKKNNEYTFFATSNSRDKIYIGPNYAQKAIIKKWINWANNYKETESNACRDVTIWYF